MAASAAEWTREVFAMLSAWMATCPPLASWPAMPASSHPPHSPASPCLAPSRTCRIRLAQAAWAFQAPLSPLEVPVRRTVWVAIRPPRRSSPALQGRSHQPPLAAHQMPVPYPWPLGLAQPHLNAKVTNRKGNGCKGVRGKTVASGAVCETVCINGFSPSVAAWCLNHLEHLRRIA